MRQPGIEPGPLPWKGRILTIRPLTLLNWPFLASLFIWQSPMEVSDLLLSVLDSSVTCHSPFANDKTACLTKWNISSNLQNS